VLVVAVADVVDVDVDAVAVHEVEGLRKSTLTASLGRGRDAPWRTAD